jgi:hypothetical protein
MTPYVQGKPRAEKGRYLDRAIGCGVAALVAGWLIVFYDNPLTGSLIIAAITAFVASIIYPKAGFYLLIV